MAERSFDEEQIVRLPETLRDAAAYYLHADTPRPMRFIEAMRAGATEIETLRRQVVEMAAQLLDLQGQVRTVSRHATERLAGATTEIETLRAIVKGVVGSHVEYSPSGQARTYPAQLSGFDAHGQLELTEEQEAALQRAVWPMVDEGPSVTT